jgi:hypothetical protein
MTVKQAYEEYRKYYRDNQWDWQDVSQYLKRNSIDYEEYDFEEFKDRVVTDDAFNAKWANGCTRELTMAERFKLAGYEYPPRGMPNIGVANLEKRGIPKRAVTE